ncbi:MAG: hypothetical protein ACKJSK_15970, partial [Roseibacillus sp.]
MNVIKLDGGGFGGLDQPAAGGRDRLPAGREREVICVSGVADCFATTTGMRRESMHYQRFQFS